MRIGEKILYLINKFFSTPEYAKNGGSFKVQFAGAHRFLNYLTSHIPLHNLDILDIGCGTCGIAARLITDYPSNRIVGVDWYEKSLRKAKENIIEKGLKNITLVRGDVSYLPFKKNSFDLVYSVSGLEHFPDVFGVFKQVHKVLRKDGYFVVDFATYPSIWGHHLVGVINVPFVHLFFSEDTLVKVFDKVLSEMDKEKRKAYEPYNWIVKWKKGKKVIAGCNKITLDYFEHILNWSNFEIVDKKYTPLFIPRRNPLRIFLLIGKIFPLQRDILVKNIQCVLRKP